MIEGSGSGSIPLTSGSGSGRPKNMWIRIRIRIRTTGYRYGLVPYSSIQCAQKRTSTLRYPVLTGTLTLIRIVGPNKGSKPWKSVQNLEKVLTISKMCSNRLIFHTFWLAICKLMRIPIQLITLMRIRIQLITLMRIRIRILPFNLMRIWIRNTGGGGGGGVKNLCFVFF